jgi:hypothetical protein
MIKINNILKQRLNENKSIKYRYHNIKTDKYHKIIFTLDNINYSLYSMLKKFFYSKQEIRSNTTVIQTYKISVTYYKNGLKHRDYDKNGNIQASFFYIPSDKSDYKEYWFNGKKYLNRENSYIND